MAFHLIRFIKMEIHMKKHFGILIALVVVAGLALSACGAIPGSNSSTVLNASGMISSRNANIVPQLAGIVVEISVEEGASVKKGDELFRLDDSLLKAQRNQAAAAVSLAEAALNTANDQYNLALNSARLQDQQNRTSSWSIKQPSQFNLPVWYFDKSEKLSSAKSIVDIAGTNLDQDKANLEKVLKDKASQEFLDAEKSVSNAQTALLIADQVLGQAKSAQNNEVLQNYAQDQYNSAENELKTAQANYKRLLATQAAIDVLEARARTRISQESYDRALDYYNSLLSGDQSLQVNVAESVVKQAEAALAQAKAALAVIDVTMDKTITRAPMDGVVLTRNLELGEMVSPGSVVMGIGQLVELELVVYIPETDYGKVKLGDQVSITTDSFPGDTFTGKVINISDQAEFTPRNVQTIDGRRATVYAIKLSVPNPDLKLKPGMPVDVSFDLAK
ncbi:MAG: hypothetical protein CVU43_12730 [Chloroflexi bacterium HGW-Chloroflexi-5]|nr:MAG: hypothetical protein CVU43_12730 [Chloroflexi bacterium HGW-Chloroflexi-5]